MLTFFNDLWLAAFFNWDFLGNFLRNFLRNLLRNFSCWFFDFNLFDWTLYIFLLFDFWFLLFNNNDCFSNFNDNSLNDWLNGDLNDWFNNWLNVHDWWLNNSGFFLRWLLDWSLAFSLNNFHSFFKFSFQCFGQIFFMSFSNGNFFSSFFHF